MASTESFRRPPTAHEAVLGELRKEIASGGLHPGEQVRQDQLAERWGVSRAPLREALKLLEGEGQVVYHPHRGYFVAELSADDLVEVYRIRELLEAEALRVGIGRATEQDRAAIAAHLQACEDASRVGDVVKLTEANRSLHFALLAPCALPRLIRMIRLCWDATDVYRSVYYAEAEHREAAQAEHRVIVAAYLEGRVEETVERLAEHREHAVAALTRSIR